MLTFKRRALRRMVIGAITLSVAFYFAGFLKDVLFGVYSRARIPRVQVPRATVTRTRTVWGQTTRTVLAPVVQHTPDIEEARRMVREADAGAGAGADAGVGMGAGVGARAGAGAEADDVVLALHDYRADGLLEVNPDGPHPIFELIARAKNEWAAKLGRASRTLDEAVAEYKRRYKRAPPLGFDDWWYYVEDNDVQLPDEYDQIFKDLEPFWGVDPKDLDAIRAEWEGHDETFTLGKNFEDIAISLLTFVLPDNEKLREELLTGAYLVMDLLADVEQYIPPFRAVFRPHDNPTMHTDYELKEMALEAAANKKYIDIANPPTVKLHGWPSACHPLSPIWRDPFDFSLPADPPTKKTFIYDHRRAMDPCLHPSIFVQHGQFISHRTGPVPHRKMYPQFSYCVTTLHHDIITAMPINWLDDILPRSDDPDWEARDDERLLWRGSNTGMWHDTDTNWRWAQRVRLVEWANALRGNISVLPSRGTPEERLGNATELSRARFSPAMFDIQFAGEPLSCAPETCRQLGREFEYRKMQSVGKAGRYKYVLDVDGNGWSSRFKRLITSNALVFKSTIYPEWFTDRIAPWVHYVPVQNDLSDLPDSFVFFRGDANGAGAHDEMAREIARAGRQWSRTFWRREDLIAYFFRLFLEYARVTSLDREAMSYRDEQSV